MFICTIIHTSQIVKRGKLEVRKKEKGRSDSSGGRGPIQTLRHRDKERMSPASVKTAAL
jgi:hypothetical protein